MGGKTTIIAQGIFQGIVPKASRLQLRHSPGFTPVFPYSVTVHLCLVILAHSTQFTNAGGGEWGVESPTPSLKRT